MTSTPPLPDPRPLHPSPIHAPGCEGCAEALSPAELAEARIDPDLERDIDLDAWADER